MVTSQLGRMVRYVRSRRSNATADPALSVDPSLPDNDLRRLRRLIDEAISAKGGEMAARRNAGSVAATYLNLDVEGRQRFFELLATEYGHDQALVDAAVDTLGHATEPADRRRAESELREALSARREHLFRRFAGLDDGPTLLVSLREDLLSRLGEAPELRSMDDDLKRILEGWFDVSLLTLERLTWDSPASLLEKLIDYEAVHAIESWADLKGRLAPDRRLYAFLHPAMPNDPLIFVEVALTSGISNALPPVLDHDRKPVAPDHADTAIFYSISNCHRGLAGVTLGDLLIKSVVDLVSTELPNVKQFATLSPLPGFRRWLESQLIDNQFVANDDVSVDLGPEYNFTPEQLVSLVSGSLPDPSDHALDAARTALTQLASHYLANGRRGNRALDPVAHFHLSNGARIERLNWWANPSTAGWERGLAMMVNYQYHLKSIEQNHDRYLIDGEVAVADGVRRLLGEPS